MYMCKYVHHEIVTDNRLKSFLQDLETYYSRPHSDKNVYRKQKLLHELLHDNEMKGGRGSIS